MYIRVAALLKQERTKTYVIRIVRPNVNNMYSSKKKVLFSLSKCNEKSVKVLVLDIDTSGYAAP